MSIQASTEELTFSYSYAVMLIFCTNTPFIPARFGFTLAVRTTSVVRAANRLGVALPELGCAFAWERRGLKLSPGRVRGLKRSAQLEEVSAFEGQGTRQLILTSSACGSYTITAD